MTPKMDVANKFGLTAVFTKDTGATTKPMAEADLFMRTAMFMKVNGRTIKRMVSESIRIPMEPHMKDIGLRTNSTAMEQRLGLMERNIEENIKKERRMGKDNLNGQITRLMMDNSLITILTESDSTFGLTKENTMGNGKIIRCMEKVYLRGLMAGNIQVLITMIESMG